MWVLVLILEVLGFGGVPMVLLCCGERPRDKGMGFPGTVPSSPSQTLLARFLLGLTGCMWTGVSQEAYVTLGRQTVPDVTPSPAR